MLLSTLRIAVAGLDQMPANQAAQIISHDLWSIGAALLLVPWHIGGFARGEISALPWIEFSIAARRHGMLDGIFSAVVVFVADLWLFWVPARIYIGKQSDSDGRVIFLTIALNLAIGLILVTSDNPLYGLLPATDRGSNETRP